MSVDRQSVAYHEAGHATVARVLGIPVPTATIVSAGGGVLGHITHGAPADHAPGTPEAEAESERFAMIAVAGSLAVRRHRRSRGEGYEEGPELEDLNRARGLIKPLMHVDEDEDDEPLLDARMERLDLSVDGLLALHWGAVERVAAGLLERETLSGPEVDELIAQAPPSDPEVQE